VIAYRFADFRAFMARDACSCEKRFEKRCLAAGIWSDKRNAARTSAVCITWTAHFDLPSAGIVLLGPPAAAGGEMLSSREAWDLARPK
jgi:hypothetical protein